MTTEITKPENPGADLLTKPCLPPEIERLVRAKYEIYKEEGRLGRRALPITKDQAKAVRKAISTFESGFTPARRPALSARVTTMLAHYFVPDMPQALADAVMTDWIEALAEYPNWAISAACKSWLHREKRKPTIADLREECCDEICLTRLNIDKLKFILKWHERNQREATKEQQNV